MTGWSVHGLCVHGLDEAAEPPAADDTRPGHPAALVRQVADRLRGGLPPTLRPFGHLPSAPASLPAAALPAWDLHRPRDWPALDDTRRLIEDTLAPGRVAGALR
ncbi:hypothetical protein [Micromonospora sp. NPDC023633]|uniref:hypothetical protein n=1 Tax=Micromonospora sp. NPDC023633 TaxID=3154320 RepID=UPI003405906F